MCLLYCLSQCSIQEKRDHDYNYFYFSLFFYFIFPQVSLPSLPTPASRPNVTPSNGTTTLIKKAFHLEFDYTVSEI